MNIIKLNNGVEMPLIGYGVMQLGDAELCRTSVTEALHAGYRLIDTAPTYGNEVWVGEAIRESGVPREEIFVSSKVWIQDTGYDNTMKAFEATLRNMQLEYLDIYLIHRPFGDYYGSWKAMTELYRAGKIRAIGVSNFFMDRFLDFVYHQEVLPAVNQIEVHPFYQQADLRAAMDKYDVKCMAWGPFAEGTRHIFENETLQTIADKYGKNIGQVILRWHLQNGTIPLPKSAHADRIRGNLQIFDFALSEEDMSAICAMETGTGVFRDKLYSEKVIRRWLESKFHD